MAKIEVAEPKDRFVAAAIDFLPPFMLFLIATPFSSGWAALLAIGGSVYLIFRDLIGNGQSIGKKLTNLHVIDSDTDRVPDPMALILRNLGFGVPGLNVVYALVEGIQVMRHGQGLRYGDMFANTGVVRVPSDEREKLLGPADRPSRVSNPRIKAPEFDVTAATMPDAPVLPQASGPKRLASDPTAGTEPGDVPQTPKRPPPKPIDLPVDRPSQSGPKPVAAPRTPAPSTSGPRPAAPAPRAPAPAQTSGPKPAAPAAPRPPAPAAAPKPAAAGVKMTDDDPLKKLVDQASGVPPKR